MFLQVGKPFGGFVGRFKPVDGGGELRFPVYRFQLPVIFRHKGVDLFLALHNHRQRGRLHAANGKHCFPLCKFFGEQAGGVHAQQPVADGARAAGGVKIIVLFGSFKMKEAFADSFRCEGRDPQSFYGGGAFGFQQHPALNQLAFLARIPAVDHFFALLHQPGYNIELLLHAGIVYELDAETGRYHGQVFQPPEFPLLVIIMRLLEGAEMPESPGYLVAIALIIALLTFFCADHFRNIPCHAWFFSNANFHHPVGYCIS